MQTEEQKIKARERQKRYRLKNAERSRQSQYEWRRKNPGTWKAAKARSYQNTKSVIVEKQRTYRETNGEVIRERDRQRHEANPEPKRLAAQKWVRENPGAKAALDLRKRESRARATPAWLTAQQKAEINAIYKEARRLTRETGIEHHVDHIHAIVGINFCGLHVPWNLQILVGLDNLKKTNRLDAAVAW